MKRICASSSSVRWSGLALLIASWLSAEAAAVPRNWVAGSGTWSTPAAWSPNGVPGAGDDVSIAPTSGGSRTITYNYTGSPVALNTLTVDATGGAGTTTLAMPANALSVADEFRVGYIGSGTFTQTGGTVTVSDVLYLGYGASAVGTATVSGATASFDSAWMSVGGFGHGDVTVEDGAVVTVANKTSIGDFDVDGTGNMLVTGEDSTFNIGGWMDVGSTGEGVLTIEDEGLVTGGAVYIGGVDTGFGQLYVSGEGSMLDTAWYVVGTAGWGELYVGDGGDAVSQSFITIAEIATSTGFASASGVGSSMEAAWGIAVGYGGNGNLTVENGGTAVAHNGIVIGDLATSLGDVVIDGAGSSMQADWGIAVADEGDASLTVSNGGSVSAANGYDIGYGAGGDGDVTVSGVGSTTSGAWYLSVGTSGSGTLTVAGGGDASTPGDLNLAVNAGSDGTININNGGTVSAGFNTFVGGWWQAAGGQGIVNVNSGGTLSTTFGLHVWNTAGNAVNLNGGTINTGGLNFNGNPALFNWTSGTLHITTSVQFDPAAAPTSTSAAFGSGLTVGSGKTFKITGYEILGGSGAFALSVTGSGSHEVTDTLEVNNGSSLDVNGGEVSVGNVLNVGRFGAGELEIAGGGEVTNTQFARLGEVAGSSGTATVSGGGSKWTVGTSIEVGRDGDGTMRVEQGGEVSVGTFTFVGTTAAGHGELTVTGAGSKMTSFSQIIVGDMSDGEVIVSAGGLLDTRKAVSPTSSSALIGRNEGITGQVTITGAGSQWVQDGTNNVGFRGIGIMDVQSGGTVHSADGAIARISPATGTATVTGAGSKWLVDNDLHVGGSVDGDGGTATLNTAAGGQVSVGDMMRVWNGGNVNLTGGTLSANSIQHTDGGVFSFTGGTLHVGTFIGNLVNAGGVLAPGASPGTTTVAGNYTQNTGTLQIELASASSFDELVVNGNVTLGGVLQVLLLGGYSPTAGASFDILDWTGTRTGTFASLSLPTLSGLLVWNTSQLYTTGVLSVAATVLAGDYNGDGAVDAADYVVWRKNDGTVTGYNTWRTNFGRTAGGGAALDGSPIASVPEPATLMLLMFAAAGRCLRRGRAA